MTTFADQVKQFGGTPVAGPFILQTGRAIFVRPSTGNDGNTGLNPSSSGSVRTLTQALALATANHGDVVYLIAESNTAASTTDYQSATLTWNKDGVHLIGINDGSFMGQRSRIGQLSTVKTVESLVTVSANNCLIANLEIFQGVTSSTATSPVALTVSGDRNKVMNCQISGNGDTGGSTDTAGARSLVVTGAENQFVNCYIGLDTVIRATQTSETSVANARNVFDDCVINSYTSLSTFKAVTTTSSATGRFVLFRNCHIAAEQNISSAVAPTGAIAHAQSGTVRLHLTGVDGYANVCTADNANVHVMAPSSSATGNAVDQGLAGPVDIA